MIASIMSSAGNEYNILLTVLIVVITVTLIALREFK